MKRSQAVNTVFSNQVFNYGKRLEAESLMVAGTDEPRRPCEKASLINGNHVGLRRLIIKVYSLTGILGMWKRVKIMLNFYLNVRQKHGNNRSVCLQCLFRTLQTSVQLSDRVFGLRDCSGFRSFCYLEICCGQRVLFWWQGDGNYWCKLLRMYGALSMGCNQLMECESWFRNNLFSWKVTFHSHCYCFALASVVDVFASKLYVSRLWQLPARSK